uniref:Uncharacterized protein n=1 Tax=Myotis myotis TaxID=51298 RepID=A0A7J7Z4T0_MYOMY|nr:hypothetical protein mMyoMyo1_010583 [Myotis myotis]
MLLLLFVSGPARLGLDNPGCPHSHARFSAWAARMHRAFLHFVSNPRRPAWPHSRGGQRVLSSKREWPIMQVLLSKAVTCNPNLKGGEMIPLPDGRSGSVTLQRGEQTGRICDHLYCRLLQLLSLLHRKGASYQKS